jgi:hypothetical protein
VSKTWDVELSVEGSVLVVVEADDEDAAHDVAVTEWRELFGSGDVDVDRVTVYSVTEARA